MLDEGGNEATDFANIDIVKCSQTTAITDGLLAMVLEISALYVLDFEGFFHFLNTYKLIINIENTIKNT